MTAIVRVGLRAVVIMHPPAAELAVGGRFQLSGRLLPAVLRICGLTFPYRSIVGDSVVRGTWDSKALPERAAYVRADHATGFTESFIVLVPGAQTSSLEKDLLCWAEHHRWANPALITIPFAYGCQT